MLQDLTSGSREVGLTINKSKTKIMTNRMEVPIIVDGEDIEWVKSYIYLGQLISMSDQMQQEMNRRVTNAWNRFGP